MRRFTFFQFALCIFTVVSLSLPHIALAQGYQMHDVVWTNPIGVTISGNTITKTGGVNGEWDSGAVSTRTFSGDGGVEYTTDSS